MTARKRQPEEAIRFGDAIEKLEGILRRVESEEIDIDELAEELKKAAELLEVCRAKIRKAEIEVTQIVQALEESDEDELAQEIED
jgi:exodeoxyribonuclease VII small subunit